MRSSPASRPRPRNLFDTLTLSNAQARRIALAAQGFADPRPTGRVDRRHLRLMVSWLELERIAVTGRGDLGPTLLQLAGAGYC